MVRTVPSMNAVSGMTLVVVPDSIRPMVTTAGSKTSTLLVTIDCRAKTISHAPGIGSSARYGIDACPPRPRTVIVNSSADASIVPDFVETDPAGWFGVWWMANARSTSPVASSKPSSSITRAPWKPSSPGWNIPTTVPHSRSRTSLNTRRAPHSIATCESWPHECAAPATVLANSRPVSSRIGSASMSARNNTVGPGRSVRSVAITLDRSRPT